jgi:hypothetical protein
MKFEVAMTVNTNSTVKQSSVKDGTDPVSVTAQAIHVVQLSEGF